MPVNKHTPRITKSEARNGANNAQCVHWDKGPADREIGGTVSETMQHVIVGVQFSVDIYTW